MHICFSTIDYHQSGQGGGIASYLDTIAPALLAQGHEVTILAPGKQHKRYSNTAGVRIWQQRLGSWHWYLYKLKMPTWIYLLVREWEWSRTLYRTVKELHQSHPVDIIESHEVGLGYLVKKRRALPPIAVRLHGTGYMFQKFSGQRPNLGARLLHALELKWLTKVAGVSAPGLFQANYYQKLIKRPIRHIANPVSEQFISLKERSLLKARPVILYTGRIEYRKGSLVLLESFGLLLKKIPEVQLIIAGERHNSISEAQWQASIKKHGVGSNLQCLGHVAFQELKVWYQKASVFVMPSYYETFGISVVEAMAQGLPVVATTAGALPELVENGVTGLTVPPGDAEALAQALITLLAEPGRAQAMGAKGKAKVQENYSPKAVAQQTLQFYQKQLAT